MDRQDELPETTVKPEPATTPAAAGVSDAVADSGGPPTSCAVCPPLDGRSEDPLDDTEAAEIARAMGHPVRVRILRILGARDTCYCGDLCEEFDLAQSTVSQHLKVLREAGLVRGTRQGTCMCYCIEAGRLQAFRRWAAEMMASGQEVAA